MKVTKLSNSFFLTFGLLSLVLSLGTGCGGSSGGGTPNTPRSEAPGEENIDEGTRPDQPPPRT